jgi:hypothetical protein
MLTSLIEKLITDGCMKAAIFYTTDRGPKWLSKMHH